MTKVFPRPYLLTAQVAWALRRAWIEPATVDRIRTGLDNQWLDKIAVYGIDGEGAAWCRLVLRIDWARHELHMAAGRVTVEIDERWQDDTAIEVDEVVRLFEMCRYDNGLSSLMHVWYVPNQDRSLIRRTLGFVPSDPVQWAEGIKSRGGMMDIRELDELAVGFDVVTPRYR